MIITASILLYLSIAYLFACGRAYHLSKEGTFHSWCFAMKSEEVSFDAPSLIGFSLIWPIYVLGFFLTIPYLIIRAPILFFVALGKKHREAL